MGNRKIRNNILILAVCTIFGWIVLNNIYLYTPFNFTSDKVTRGDWYWYKNPVTINISQYNKENKVEEITISDKLEVKMFLKELKMGKEIQNYQVPTSIKLDEQYFVVLLSGNSVLFSAIGITKDNVLALNHINSEAVSIQLTESLKGYISKKLSQTKSVQ
ncbi:hypothetical protein [Ammoniphilus sp. 3BR4]|uniref:hypothetical protein n=1 Tax=Ammoniphilus sp. 3BR4 TaxID=3158265 RepID=UPI003467BACA